MSFPVPVEALLRVDRRGIVVAASEAAVGMLGQAVGRPCNAVLGVRTRDGCDACGISCTATRPGAQVAVRRLEGAVVRGHVAHVTCTRVGDETVVQLVDTGLGAKRFPERLTRRERQVLEQVARGLTNDAIAAELGVRPPTVRTHVEHLRAKLGAATRAEAVAIATAIGELSPRAVG